MSLHRFFRFFRRFLGRRGIRDFAWSGRRGRLDICNHGRFRRHGSWFYLSFRIFGIIQEHLKGLTFAFHGDSVREDFRQLVFSDPIPGPQGPGFPFPRRKRPPRIYDRGRFVAAGDRHPYKTICGRSTGLWAPARGVGRFGKSFLSGLNILLSEIKA